MRWQDVVDILLNSYILFRFYVLFRGTNVFRVITGITILWFFQRIAFSLGLIVTSWAMQGITAVAALIIIIVFRNEIRSVLQAKNLKSILWDFPNKTDSTLIEILVNSIFELAQRDCGALIVLPGKEDLRGFVKGGIPWHGLISKEMISSIFWHDNPVHDGAIIVQGNQITKVSVILPLSNRENLPSFYMEGLPSFYGTRHRAAVGLAETTDALVIVVSEERGLVSVAKGSGINDVRNESRLTKLIQKHVGISEKDTAERPKKERFEIMAAALASFLFITGVWFSFSQGQATLITLEVPVEYVKRNPEIEILETSVDTVTLHLSGSGALIKSIRPGQVHVKLDLNKAVVGLNTLTITRDNITLPPGVFLKKVQPLIVEATLDIPGEKILPIQVDWVGKMPDDITIGSVNIKPNKIKVIGGTKILENISTIYTAKVPLNNIRNSGTMIINLVINPVSLKIDADARDKIILKYFTKKRL